MSPHKNVYLCPSSSPQKIQGFVRKTNLICITTCPKPTTLTDKAYLFHHYFKKTIDLKKVIYSYDCHMGHVGPRDLRLETSSNIMKSHAIFHDAFGWFDKKYGRGRGYCYTSECAVR